LGSVKKCQITNLNKRYLTLSTMGTSIIEKKILKEKYSVCLLLGEKKPTEK
jgi:hypothetical protein